MSRSQPLAAMIAPEAFTGNVRSPRTAELVAHTLRRMIVEGQLTDGDHLPPETELMNHFGVSRPTLREAIRVLEAERLVEVRRGSRTGARICVPGAEIVARPAGLLLELSGATLGDVMTARVTIEPPAARLLAASGTATAHKELDRLAREIPRARESGGLGEASAMFHRRLVELSGNATLGIIAGMLYEISARHTSTALKAAEIPQPQYNRMVKSYTRLVDLVKARNANATEAHWRKHMEIAGAELLKGYEKTKVRDIMQ
jgi:GntR family transcriptional repressor for pyruvate dehydrogenase complex